MPKVVVRSGNDWIEVSVDGKYDFSGHSLSPRRWCEVMKACGVEIDYDNDGDFCSYCGEWTNKVLKVFEEDICPECYEKHKDDE